MKLYNRFSLGDTSLTASTNILLAVLGVATGSLAARLLGPEQRGVLAAIQLPVGLLAPLAAAGLPDAVTYFTSKLPKQSRKIAISATGVSAIAGLLFALLAQLLIPQLLAAQPASVQRTAMAYIWLLPLNALWGTHFNALRGLGYFRFWNATRPLSSVAWLLVLLVCWAGGIRDAEVFAMMLVIALAVVNVPLFVLTTVKTEDAQEPSTISSKALIRYGAPLAAASLPQQLNLRVDQLVIAAVLAPGQLGLYVVAVSWSSAVLLLPSAIGTVLFPATARVAEHERPYLIRQALKRCALVAAGISALFIVLAPVGVRLAFGSAFDEAASVSRVLCLAAAIAAFTGVMQDALRGIGQTFAVFESELIGLTTTILTVVPVTTRFGLEGAAWLSVASYAVVATRTAWRLRRALTSPVASLGRDIVTAGGDSSAKS